VAILHNMVTEKRRDGYVSRTRMADAAQAAAGGSGGDGAVCGGAEGMAFPPTHARPLGERDPVVPPPPCGF